MKDNLNELVTAAAFIEVQWLSQQQQFKKLTAQYVYDFFMHFIRSHKGVKGIVNIDVFISNVLSYGRFLENVRKNNERLTPGVLSMPTKHTPTPLEFIQSWGTISPKDIKVSNPLETVERLHNEAMRHLKETIMEKGTKKKKQSYNPHDPFKDFKRWHHGIIKDLTESLIEHGKERDVLGELKPWSPELMKEILNRLNTPGENDGKTL